MSLYTVTIDPPALLPTQVLLALVTRPLSEDDTRDYQRYLATLYILMVRCRSYVLDESTNPSCSIIWMVWSRSLGR
jgi:hypothetical protein